MLKFYATVALLFAVVAAGSPTNADDRVRASDERAYSAFSEDKHRQFDFWIGEWDVNLRMLQDDLTFKDTIAAKASIYSILHGKAILELWDSGPIKGYSLRYFDPQSDQWVLWLNWPGENRSRLSSLAGEFRHGRGDFRSEYVNAEGTTIMQRYSFNDITPFSLRWDDLASNDGGRTWRKNWRMEFTRTAVEPQLPFDSTTLPTYDTGARCSDEAFRTYEGIVGHWQGRMNDADASLSAWHVLDGCAVIALVRIGAEPTSERFLFLTFNTDNERWEVNYLDDDYASGMLRLTSDDSWANTSSEGRRMEWTLAGDQLEYRFSRNGELVEGGDFARATASE